MKIGRDLRVPMSRCTNCGEENDGALGIGVDKSPRPGDYSLCIECGHLMVFDEQLKVRDPTSAELDAIAGNENLVKASNALHKLHEDRRKNPYKYEGFEPKKTC
jgi:hypothetical protein